MDHISTACSTVIEETSCNWHWLESVRDHDWRPPAGMKMDNYHYIWPNARAEAAVIPRAGADHVLGMPSRI